MLCLKFYSSFSRFFDYLRSLVVPDEFYNGFFLFILDDIHFIFVFLQILEFFLGCSSGTGKPFYFRQGGLSFKIC